MTLSISTSVLDGSFSVRYSSHAETYEIFETNEIDLKENEINELSIYNIHQLSIEIKEEQIILSSEEKPFRLTKRDRRLRINMPPEPFTVIVDEHDEKYYELQYKRDPAIEDIYKEKYTKQWEIYKNNLVKEYTVASKLWILNGSALKLRFFNFHNIGGAITLHNGKKESIQIDNSKVFLPSNSFIELKSKY